MSRYIDADVFMKNLKTNEHGDTDVNQVEIAINKSRATDVVEVVRCKDCKFWDSDCIWCDLWGNTQEYYDGYCNYGERKDNGSKNGK